MHISVGTFNVNNLFSRFNFELKAEVEKLPEGKVPFTKIRQIVDDVGAEMVQYEGWALKRKDPKERRIIADRIKTMDLDVIALQEVEDIETLRYFTHTELNNLYPYAMLIEGNDPRLIDVAVLSKLPIGQATTWQTAAEPTAPKDRIFSRDLLQVEILNNEHKPLLTLFATHLKSHYVPFTEDQEEGAKQANERRRLQAETAALIIEKTMRPDSRFIVLGDMNDGPDSAFLRPLLDNVDLQLVNGLANAKETRAAPKTNAPIPTSTWTHRFKPTGKPAHYELFDHIWLSPSLAPKLKAAYIDRRTKMGGDGSDHDPAWVELDV
ncbi:MAG TPA: endonuclease/exonuclease/phosphatase family protein [Candidatus Saccharimonadales bacterium]|nr:endonuclease/exonuclease/phosphatase family protein [Candidatus Saccharimonadales bacterium]